MHHYLPEHDVAVNTANGLLDVSSKDWLIGKHLFVQRNYELDFIRTSIEFLQSGGHLKTGKNRVVVDIGANLGMIGIALARNEYFDRVLAFEPEPRNFRLLEKNVKQNGLSSRISCFRAALSSVEGDIEFEIGLGNSGDSRVRRTDRRGDLKEHLRQTISVPAITFDSFIKGYDVAVADEIDLFWIDIQGHEGHFFSGAQDFFSKRKVPVVNEFWGYGIARSGMSRDEYCGSVRKIFSCFYLFSESGYERKSIDEIDLLFDVYKKPREIANIILV